MGILVEVAVGVAVFLVTSWIGSWLLVVILQAMAARDFRSRGLVQVEALISTTLLAVLSWAGCLGLGALGGWATARFLPEAWAWTLHSWGIRVGCLASLARLAFTFLGRSGREAGERVRALFLTSHEEDLPKRLTPRQDAYVRHYRKLMQSLEEEDAGNADEPGDGGEGRLGFVIERTEERQELRDQPPGFGPGGDWTVVACRLEHHGRPARFFLAERSGPPGKDLPIAWGEGRLWTQGSADAAALLAAFKEAFPTEETVETEGAAPGPLTASTVVLGRGLQRHKDRFAGKGTWTATKWTFDEAEELFVNWSPSEKRGEFAEKDEMYRPGLWAAFEALAGRQPFSRGAGSS